MIYPAETFYITGNTILLVLLIVIVIVLAIYLMDRRGR